MIQAWLKMRTPKERIGITLIIALLSIWLWNLLWENHYQFTQTQTSAQIENLQQKITQFQQEDVAIKNMLKDPALAQKQAALKKQLDDMNQQLNALSTQLVSSAEMVKALENILAEDPNLTLTKLENTGNSLITPKNANKLYRHDFTLQFKGDYFSTLTYLKKLESLPWQLYWDSINYQVNSYPVATITIKLHTLSPNEELINA